MTCACKHEIHYDGAGPCIDSPEGDPCLCTRSTPGYSDKLDPDQQITTEERIASLIHDTTTSGEDLAQKLSREILRQVLWEFRPDLFED